MLGCGEQIVTPFDGGPHRLVARQGGALHRLESGCGRRASPRAFDGQHANASCRELDRQGHAVQMGDLCNRRLIFIIKLEVLIDGLGAIDKKRDRVVDTSEGSRYLRSPAVTKGSRLVARIRTCGQLSSTAFATTAASCATCSQLSRISSAV